MRPLIFVTALLAVAASAFAEPITLTLDTPVGYPSGSNTALCQTTGTAPCIIFTGTITDNDNDPSAPFVSISDVLLTSTNPLFAAYFTQDNTLFINVGSLSGDPDWATDNLGNPSNTYSGPIFGLDFAPGAPIGVYNFTAQLEAVGGDFDSGNGIVSNVVSSSVTVTPEPVTYVLLLSALPVAMQLRRRSKV